MVLEFKTHQMLNNDTKFVFHFVGIRFPFNTRPTETSPYS